MYRLGVKRSFMAQHYLIGGDFGEENNWHSHHYELELRIEGEELDRYGYLLDITDIEQALNVVLTRFTDATLNKLPEFEGLNPSLEHFARVIFDLVAPGLAVENIEKVVVRIWEEPGAWVEYSRPL